MFAEHPDVHFIVVRRGQCLLFAEHPDIHFIVVRRVQLNILVFILLLSGEVS